VNIRGFQYAAAAAGIRKKDRLDLGLIYAEKPAAAAGVFTTGRVKAAPVLLDMERLAGGRVQAILVNSGVANACTGVEGLAAAKACSAMVAEALNIDENLVQLASTGVIGEQLPVEKRAAVMGDLVDRLAPAAAGDVARAIMTTDTVPKTAERSCSIGSREVKLFGMAKGAGMIMPNMATMLSFVMTDADIGAAVLQHHLVEAVNRSFNRITIDGDTSTNDTVLALAGCSAGNPALISLAEPGNDAFGAALKDLLRDLALQIVADGEGATKLVTVRVINAASSADAEQAARTIANSPLVKTAFFGEDANWGRIIAALGRSGAAFAPDRVDITFDDVRLVRNGMALGPAVETAATAVLKKDRFTVNVDLKAGKASDEIYTTDLSLDYIKINADYRS
jgi:glutamate N-acetyltransferase/amino-acid N-acetyltransferase